GTAVLEAHEVFQEDLQRYRQPRDIAEPRRLRRRVKTEIIVALAVHIEGAAGLQRVVTGDAHGQVSLERGALSAARQEAKLGGHDTPPAFPIKAAKWPLRYPPRRAAPRPPESASNNHPRPARPHHRASPLSPRNSMGRCCSTPRAARHSGAAVRRPI